MTIESRKRLMQVEFEAIEQVSESKEGRLNIEYFSANKLGSGFSKKSVTFDCFEVSDIVKVFSSIRTIV